MLSEAERAVLAHPDAVAESAAFDLPSRRARLRGQSQRRYGRKSECEV